MTAIAIITNVKDSIYVNIWRLRIVSLLIFVAQAVTYSSDTFRNTFKSGMFKLFPEFAHMTVYSAIERISSGKHVSSNSSREHTFLGFLAK